MRFSLYMLLIVCDNMQHLYTCTISTINGLFVPFEHPISYPSACMHVYMNYT